MALNDTISSLLEKIGLKKSDLGKCRDAILAHEERIKDLNDDLSGKFDEMQRLERSLRDLKAKYDAASQASRKLLESQIRSLMRDFSGLKEMQDIVLRNLEKEKLLLRNRRIELEHLRHPTDVDSIVDAQERKDEIISDLEEEDAEVSELAGRVYRREEDVKPVQEDSSDTLGSEMDALLGSPTAVAEKGGNPADETPPAELKAEIA